MKDKLILKDGTVIELEAAASLNSLETIFSDWGAAALTMIKLTEENITSVQVLNGDGLAIGNYSDLVMEGGRWVFKDNVLCIGISLREKTELEKRMDDMESGQEVQNEAITELAGMVGGGA